MLVSPRSQSLRSIPIGTTTFPNQLPEAILAANVGALGVVLGETIHLGGSDAYFKGILAHSRQATVERGSRMKYNTIGAKPRYVSDRWDHETLPSMSIDSASVELNALGILNHLDYFTVAPQLLTPPWVVGW